MGLRNTVKKAAQTAVNSVGDLAVTVTYHSFATTTYNVTTGSTTETYTSSSGVLVVFSDFTLLEKAINQGEEAKIDSRSKKVIIPTLNISGITPSVKDKLVTDTGETWEIYEINTDAAEASWNFISRRT